MKVLNEQHRNYSEHITNVAKIITSYRRLRKARQMVDLYLEVVSSPRCNQYTPAPSVIERDDNPK